jgi:hypothetical protein
MNLEENFHYSPIPPKSPFAPIDFRKLLSIRAEIIKAETMMNHHRAQMEALEEQIVSLHEDMLNETDHAFTEHIDTIYVECGNLWVLKRETVNNPSLRKGLTFKEVQLRKVGFETPTAKTFKE